MFDRCRWRTPEDSVFTLWAPAQSSRAGDVRSADHPGLLPFAKCSLRSHSSKVALSIRVLRGAPNKKASFRWLLLFGAPRRTRTSNPLIRSQILYPIELGVPDRRDCFTGIWRRWQRLSARSFLLAAAALSPRRGRRNDVLRG